MAIETIIKKTMLIEIEHLRAQVLSVTEMLSFYQSDVDRLREENDALVASLDEDKGYKLEVDVFNRKLKIETNQLQLVLKDLNYLARMYQREIESLRDENVNLSYD